MNVEQNGNTELEVELKQGRVKWFNDAKGFGFIINEEGPDIFVHYSAIEGDGYRSLTAGQEVIFHLQNGPKGLHAMGVRKGEMMSN